MNLQEVFVKHKCDKGIKHRYWELYEQDFQKHKDEPINILEIGTFKGESTNAWLEYFPNATIYGVDIFHRIKEHELPILQNPRVKYLKLDMLMTWLDFV